METAAFLDFENAEWFSGALSRSRWIALASTHDSPTDRFAVEFYLREQDMGVLAGKSSQQRKEDYADELSRRYAIFMV